MKITTYTKFNTKVIIIVSLFVFLNSSFLIHTSFAQWVKTSSGMGNTRYVNSFAANGNNFFAGTDIGVYVSTNSGLNWSQTALNNKYVSSLSIIGNYMFAGTYDYSNPSGVYLSTNMGQSWVQTSLNNHVVNSLVANGNTIFAGISNTTPAANGGIYLSTNNGQSWVQTSLNNMTIRKMYVNSDKIYAAAGVGGWGAFVSANNGNSWTKIWDLGSTVITVAANGSNIFVAPYNDGVERSTDGGIHWDTTNLNFGYVYSIIINGNNIFAGKNGFYRSTNNGQYWESKSEGMGSLYINDLFIYNNFIYAGIEGYSVYRRPLSEVIGIQNISTEIPSSYSLGQNYPNPFNPTTKIRFDISGTSVAQTFLSVYDILGREIATLVNEQLQPGIYEVDFDGSNYPSGVYFCKLSVRQDGSAAESFSEVKRMVLIK